jgi:hypothetical protein
VEGIGQKSGPITVNRKLYEIVREVGGDEIVLKASTIGWVEVLAGRSSSRS